MASAVKVALIAIVKFHYIDCLMASPKDCKSLQDVRREIDRLDEQIIRLLGERAGYVHAAARFKISEEHVAAPDRQRAMMQVRREWAERQGLSADVIHRARDGRVAGHEGRVVVCPPSLTVGAPIRAPSVSERVCLGAESRSHPIF
jgi:isochorismate pyruvate lyase